MPLQYRFNHTCGHIAIGSLMNTPNQPSQPPTTVDPPRELILHIRNFTLAFPCPFCSSQPPPSNAVSPGHGFLGVLVLPPTTGHTPTIATSNPGSPMPFTNWTLIRPCAFADLKPSLIERLRSLNGRYSHVAWIPRPCGEVEITGGIEAGGGEREHITQVKEAWRESMCERDGEGQGFGAGGSGRFGGLLSQLNAAILSGDKAGR